uniref:Uncharacterized protein n=1 Tax=Knipowitschia caucasica TaxID=637954 RepID=A0AAV2M1A3_KNICA
MTNPYNHIIALKRSFDIDDDEDLPTSPIPPASPRYYLSRTKPTLHSRPYPSLPHPPPQDPRQAGALGSSLSFNKATPNGNGSCVTRAASFQSRFSPNGYSSNDSLHSSTSSLEYSGGLTRLLSYPGPHMAEEYSHISNQQQSFDANFNHRKFSAESNAFLEPHSPFFAESKDIRDLHSPFSAESKDIRDLHSPFSAESKDIRDLHSPFSAESKDIRDLHSPFSSGSKDFVLSQSPFSVESKAFVKSHNPFSTESKMFAESQSPFAAESKAFIESSSPFSSVSKSFVESQSPVSAESKAIADQNSPNGSFRTTMGKNGGFQFANGNWNSRYRNNNGFGDDHRTFDNHNQKPATPACHRKTPQLNKFPLDLDRIVTPSPRASASSSASLSSLDSSDTPVTPPGPMRVPRVSPCPVPLSPAQTPCLQLLSGPQVGLLDGGSVPGGPASSESDELKDSVGSILQRIASFSQSPPDCRSTNGTLSGRVVLPKEEPGRHADDDYSATVRL